MVNKIGEVSSQKSESINSLRDTQIDSPSMLKASSFNKKKKNRKFNPSRSVRFSSVGEPSPRETRVSKSSRKSEGETTKALMKNSYEAMQREQELEEEAAFTEALKGLSLSQRKHAKKKFYGETSKKSDKFEQLMDC